MDLLQAHRDVTSVGINGYALKSDPKSGPAGIWVVAVKPGSVAAASGILPGDVVTDLAGTAMAADGTMAGYCDVLSGYHDGDALPFSVYRADDRANLKGTLNGKAIEPGFAFAVALGGGASGPGQDWETRSTQLRGNLSVDAPPEWESSRSHVGVRRQEGGRGHVRRAECRCVLEGVSRTRLVRRCQCDDR